MSHLSDPLLMLITMLTCCLRQVDTPSVQKAALSALFDWILCFGVQTFCVGNRQQHDDERDEDEDEDDAASDKSTHRVEASKSIIPVLERYDFHPRLSAASLSCVPFYCFSAFFYLFFFFAICCCLYQSSHLLVLFFRYLDVEDEQLQALAAQGFAKLLLHNHVDSPQV